MIFARIGLSSLGLMELNSDITITYPQLYLALISGLFFIPTGMYGFFTLARKIQAENFSILTAFLPLFAFCVEFIAYKIGFLELKDMNLLNYLSLGVIIIGALYISKYRVKANTA